MSEPSAANRDLPVLLREDADRVVTLRLNRPDQLNALSEAMLGALEHHLDDIAKDSSARCVIIASSGKAFCAGHDLREMRQSADLGYYQTLFMRCSKVMQALQSVPVPVIAQVQGLATAAGCQLVATCDLAIAADTARFAVSGINVGLFCSTPAVALSRNVSPKRAFDMLVTADFIDAETAAQWGLINLAVPADQLEDAVSRKVARIVEKSPTAVRYGKAMFYQQRTKALPEAYAYAAEIMARNMMEADAGEGIDAFLEKRRPRWQQL